MWNVIKGFTKAGVRIATSPIPMIADVVTMGGTFTGKKKMYTEEMIEELEEDFEEMFDED